MWKHMFMASMVFYLQTKFSYIPSPLINSLNFFLPCVIWFKIITPVLIYSGGFWQVDHR